jgi:putative ABC transport system ATP-binding protein
MTSSEPAGVVTTRVRVAGGCRTYVRGDERVRALRGVDLALEGGEFVALLGPSGSGKSTLLLVLAGWETLDEGSVEISSYAAQGTAAVRGETTAEPITLGWDRMGIVPQSLGLLDDLTVEENVLLPARLGANRRRVASLDGPDAHAGALMVSLDIARLKRARANELSLGEQQRVAVARALASKQSIVLADEPSTHQDADHAAAVFRALRAAADAGSVVVVATHDPDGLAYADRVIAMADGVLTTR